MSIYSVLKYWKGVKYLSLSSAEVTAKAEIAKNPNTSPSETGKTAFIFFAATDMTRPIEKKIICEKNSDALIKKNLSVAKPSSFNPETNSQDTAEYNRLVMMIIVSTDNSFAVSILCLEAGFVKTKSAVFSRSSFETIPMPRFMACIAPKSKEYVKANV